MSFTSVFQTISEKVSDLSELSVTTVEGSLTLSADDNAISDLDALLSQINAKATLGAKVLASTRIRLDGDTIAYYDQEIDDAKRDAHAALLVQAANTRQDTVDLFKELFKLNK